jgi:hypothetical protein
MQRSTRALVGALGLAAASAGLAPAAEATLVPMSLRIEVLFVDAGVTAVAVGDRFRIELTIDDTAVDDGTTLGGHFPGLLTSFSMTSHPANTGSWEASGVFDLGAASNFVTIANGDAFTFQLHGMGFPDGGPGLPFFDVDIDFTYGADISDSGMGQTFAEQFPAGFDPSLAGIGTGRIRFEPTPGSFPAAHFDAPEPGAAGLLLAALCLLARRRARRCG